MLNASGGHPGGDFKGQLELALDWGKEPWQGWSPRYLTSVDKFVSFPKPATEMQLITDPAQTKICVAVLPVRR